MVLLKNSVTWILCTLLMAGCVVPQKKVVSQGGNAPFEGVSPYSGVDRTQGQTNDTEQNAAAGVGTPYSEEMSGGMGSGGGLSGIQFAGSEAAR